MTELKNVRKDINHFPILCGSGVDEENVLNLFKYADGAIVSTSLKDGGGNKKDVNVKVYSQRISLKKVVDLMEKIKKTI